jgi:nucleoside-diphosphate kinase
MANSNITLTLIKPKTVANFHTGDILSHIEKAGFRIKALKMIQLPIEKAELFYGVHRGKPFFEELVVFMSSGPIVAAILEKENAVEDFRKLLGATDPKDASPGTLRNLFATGKTHNAVHGSDSDENALLEAKIFFSELERF